MWYTLTNMCAVRLERRQRDETEEPRSMGLHTQLRGSSHCAEGAVRTPAPRSDSIAVVKVIPAQPQAEYKLREPEVAGDRREPVKVGAVSFSPNGTVGLGVCQLPCRVASGGITRSSSPLAIR